MSSFTPTMIVSGVSYEVLAVGGQPPTTLADLAAASSFTLQGPTGRHEVHGSGAEHDGRVRFHEKADAGSGKDVRVWTVHQTEAGGFCAESA